MSDGQLQRRFIIPVSRNLAILAAALLLLIETSAVGDKIFLTNGHVIEDVTVLEEFPSRIKIFEKGRSYYVPRSRISEIAHESESQLIQSMINQARTALDEGDVEETQRLMNEIKLLARPGSSLTVLEDLEERLIEMEVEGSGKLRRQRAEQHLAEARASFDRVQTQQGIGLLIQALREDPTLEAAHDEMGRYMEEHRPVPLELAIDYFCDLAEPEALGSNHAVIRFCLGSMLNSSAVSRRPTVPKSSARRRSG